MAVRQLARLGGEFVSDRVDAAFALNQFENHARRALVEGLFQRFQIVRVYELHAGYQRLEIGAVFGLACNGKRAQRAARGMNY